MAHQDVNGDGRVPLFVTRYSLSPKTAIGVQTKHYVDAFADWQQLHWVEFGSFFERDPRSTRMGNFLVGKWPHYAAKLGRIPGLKRFTQPVWRGDVLDEQVRRDLVARYRGKTGAIYMAPVEAVDASRMRYLAELLDRPFVLHLWDSLHQPLLKSEHHRWLIEHAHQVLALSKPLMAEAGTLRPDTSKLLFVRETTEHRAKAPGTGPLRIALIGFLSSYLTGLDLLHEAYKKMLAAGIAVELHYIGSARTLRRLNRPEITKDLLPTGHLKSNADRDAALATCHIAFLPGPLETPEEDMRSRYSIPSRVLDFMAVGLPVVGTVHPRSATAQFCAEYGIGEHLLCGSASDIAKALTALREPAEWERAQQASLLALDRIDCPGQLRRLREAMAAAAAAA